MCGQTPGRQRQERIEALRDTAALTFLGFLIGLAYQEAVAPAGRVLSETGVTLVDGAMFLGFFLLGLTTFLFGSYNLAGSQRKKVAWLANFTTMVLEGVILIFLARVVSADATRGATVGFVELVFAFLVVDALWNVVTLVALRSDRTVFDVAKWFAIVVVAALVALAVIVLLPMRPASDSELVAIGALLVALFVAQAALLVKHALV
jgi:hypothetical protein